MPAPRKHETILWGKSSPGGMTSFCTSMTMYMSPILYCKIAPVVIRSTKEKSIK